MAIWKGALFDANGKEVSPEWFWKNAKSAVADSSEGDKVMQLLNTKGAAKLVLVKV